MGGDFNNDVILIGSNRDISHKKTTYTIPKRFTLNESSYVYTGVISVGTYGLVLKYVNAHKNIKCLKLNKVLHMRYNVDLEDGDEDGIEQDILVLDIIKKNKDYKEYVVQADYVIKNSMKYLIMEYFPTTLFRVFEDNVVSREDTMSIIVQVVLALIFLYKNGICYTDISCSNIMCNYSKNSSTIEIKLADLGSGFIKNTSGIATYPAVSRPISGIIDSVNEKDVVWGVGVIILHLFKEDISSFEFQKIDDSKITETKQKFIDKFSFLNDVIMSSLEFDQEVRVNLEELLDKLLLL